MFANLNIIKHIIVRIARPAAAECIWAGAARGARSQGLRRTYNNNNNAHTGRGGYYGILYCIPTRGFDMGPRFIDAYRTPRI